MTTNHFITSNTSKTLLLLFLVIIALVIAVFFYRHFFTPPTAPKRLIADAIITDMDLVKTDQTGAMTYKFLSKEAYHYEEQNRTDFTAPIGYYYTKDQPYWKLTADHGQALQGDEIIHLLGNVYVHQDAGKNNHEVTLTTSKATLYPAQKIAKNNVFVKVTEPGIVVTSIGFHANMKLGKITLLSKVKGNFTPQPKVINNE